MERFQGNPVICENGEMKLLLIDRKTGHFYGRHSKSVCEKLCEKMNRMDERIKELERMIDEQ